MATFEHDPLMASTKPEYDKIQEEKAHQQFLIDSGVLSGPQTVPKPVAIKSQRTKVILSVGEDWKSQARCTEIDKEYFFSNEADDKKWARKVCGMCVVRETCRIYAAQHGETFGIWGGMDFNIAKERNAARAAIGLRPTRERHPKSA